MLRRLMVVATLVCAVGALIAGAGSAAAVTAVGIAYDYGPKAPSAADMMGPAAGWIVPKQLRSGNLEINIEVRRADANATYNFELWCGSTHATAGAEVWFVAGAVTTNAAGAGSAQVVVPAAALDVCGPGSHTGHVDLQNATTELAATPIEFSA